MQRTHVRNNICKRAFGYEFQVVPAGYAKLDEVDGPFVFYPLHTEPEASIGR